MRVLHPPLLLFALLPLATAGVAVLAVHRYPPYFDQPHALLFLLEALLPLAVSLVAVVAVAVFVPLDQRRPLYFATAAGLVLSLADTLGLCIENGIPFAVQGPALQISLMALLFLSWAGVAFRLAVNGTRPLLALGFAVWSAVVTMLTTILPGALLELFLHPPAPAAILTWGEYQRSHWTNPHAFGIANTFDSICSHLLLSPIAAVLFAALGLAVAAGVRRLRSPAANTIVP